MRCIAHVHFPVVFSTLRWGFSGLFVCMCVCVCGDDNNSIGALVQVVNIHNGPSAHTQRQFYFYLSGSVCVYALCAEHLYTLLSGDADFSMPLDRAHCPSLSFAIAMDHSMQRHIVNQRTTRCCVVCCDGKVASLSIAPDLGFSAVKVFYLCSGKSILLGWHMLSTYFLHFIQLYLLAVRSPIDTLCALPSPISSLPPSASHFLQFFVFLRTNLIVESVVLCVGLCFNAHCSPLYHLSPSTFFRVYLLMLPPMCSVHTVDTQLPDETWLQIGKISGRH